MANKIQLRRDTAANWTTANPVLGQGEPGTEIDTGRLKIGDGVKDWKTLPDISDSHLQFTQAGTGAKQRSLTDKLQDMVSVKDFGAVGDGNADDTVAIQAAIDSGRAAFVPKGVYKISATLNLLDGYKSLIGDKSLPVISKTSPGPAIKIATTAGAKLNEYSSVENLYLRSVPLPTFPTAPGEIDAAIVLSGMTSTMSAAVQNALIKGVRIGNWSCGIYARSVVGCRIEACFVQILQDMTASPGLSAANKFCGYVLDATPFAPGGISPLASIELVDNDVTGAGLPTSITSMGYWAQGDDVRDIFFDRCETSKTSYGYYIESGTSDYNWDIHIRRPIVDEFTLHGIFAKGLGGVGGLTVIGGYFAGGSSAGACIRAESCTGVNITGGVQFLGLANDSVHDEGVYLFNCRGSLIAGNSFQNCRYAISLQNTQCSSITGNIISASATATEATPTLDNAIRVFGTSEENTIVGNAIQGKDAGAVVKYLTGIIVDTTALRTVVVGNVVDEGSCTTAYDIKNTTTTLLSSDAALITSNTVELRSATSQLALRGNNGTRPVMFQDGGGTPLSYVMSNGGYEAGSRLTLKGSDATHPIVFMKGDGTAIGKIDNAGVYTPGAP